MDHGGHITVDGGYINRVGARDPRSWREERRSSRSKKRQKPGILGRAQSAAIANPL